MTDATTEFFNELGARGHEPLLGKTRGTLRFDLANGDETARWLIAIEDGDVAVSRKNAKADCVVRTEKTLFDGIASGTANVMTATLRGEIGIVGDRQLLVRFQRLFPGPPRKGA